MTPTPETLAAALEAVDRSATFDDVKEFYPEAYNTIRFALSFTMRAMGEPSQSVRLAGLQAFVAHAVKDRPENWDDIKSTEEPEAMLQYGREINNCEQAAAVPFKAMRDQICAEIGEKDEK